MGLLLCGKLAKQPYYYEKLDVNLWSVQELAYILYHYPVVIPEDFVDRKLVYWIREELDMAELGERLSKSLEIHEEQEKLILRILREANYYTEREIKDFELEFRRLREIGRARFTELLGDTFFRMGKYGRALEAYRESVSRQREPEVELKLADGYVTVMQFEKAAQIYEELYLESRSLEPLRKLYFLKKLEPSVDTVSKYMDDLPEEAVPLWDGQYASATSAAELSMRVQEVKDMFEKDPAESRREAIEKIKSWKREYRSKL